MTSAAPLPVHPVRPWFDRHLDVQGSKILEALVANITLATATGGTLEGGGKRRKRRLKARDRASLEAVIRTTAANLADLALADGGPYCRRVVLGRPSGKQKKYAREGEPVTLRQLPNVLRRLSGRSAGYVALPPPVHMCAPGERPPLVDEGAILILRKSRIRGQASTVEPGPWVVNLLRRLRPGTCAFTRVETDGDLVAVTKWVGDDYSTRERRYYNCPNTKEASEYRAEVARINAALKKASLEYVGTQPIDTNVRRLRRIFHDDKLTTGGRLWGGFWQNLDKNERRHLRIEGERIADLDYKNMVPRLAHYVATAHMRPEAEDMYGVIVEALEGKVGRAAVKKVFNAMLNDTGPRKRLPRGTWTEESVKPGRLPRGLTCERICDTIRERYPRIEFGKGIGLRLMFLESRILIALLHRLDKAGIAAMPMHDGVMVARSKEKRVAAIMREVSRDVLGCPLPVASKPVYERKS